jgi:hypothetical protein
VTPSILSGCTGPDHCPRGVRARAATALLTAAIDAALAQGLLPFTSDVTFDFELDDRPALGHLEDRGRGQVHVRGFFLPGEDAKRAIRARVRRCHPSSRR